MRSTHTLLILVVLAAASLVGCASDGAKHSMEHSRGVIVQHAPDDVWLAARSVMTRVGRGGADIDEVERTIGAVVDGTPVRVQIEAAGLGGDKTILRVLTDADEVGVAQDVQDWIIAQLPRW